MHSPEIQEKYYQILKFVKSIKITKVGILRMYGFRREIQRIPKFALSDGIVIIQENSAPSNDFKDDVKKLWSDKMRS